MWENRARDARNRREIRDFSRWLFIPSRTPVWGGDDMRAPPVSDSERERAGLGPLLGWCWAAAGVRAVNSPSAGPGWALGGFPGWATLSVEVAWPAAPPFLYFFFLLFLFSEFLCINSFKHRIKFRKMQNLL